jgi:hypothetical protein
MAGSPTYGTLTVDPDTRAFTVHLMDASGDTWTEQLIVAIAATYAAINAWVQLYQQVTQASVWAVTETKLWDGDADPDNATFLARSGIEAGINLGFRNPFTSDYDPLRVVAPIPAAMQGNQDIPLLTSTALSDLIVATLALKTDYNLTQGQYTVRRERTNNPRVR